ncbi:alpha/beta fold hydrolase [Seongchinamella sediminis]|uniref:Alpha/beta fold hydrolase n=1 Tax=Seongchinamella sediminis TaxID=2283635 RepID=A0A3L7DZR0_9GAMM|nr:alpha/beta hydrolase [Seongchinamella sediminis]RLQ21623.1 alpha/beta fold hydrolase [Seongchinamella sediminis]
MLDTREYHLDIGDVELAVVEWPGEGDPVLLLHATGFHSRCWNQVVTRLPGRHIYAVDLRYHGRSGSLGQVDWNVLAADISALVQRLDLRNTIGVGHSVGGYLLARAAVANLNRFRHAILIDPVITSPEFYQLAQRTAADMGASDHPVARRKNRWQDADEMFRHFQDRSPFRSWQPEVLRDYCDYALHPADEAGYRQLLCDPLNEASVYISQAYSDAVLGELEKLRIPVTLLRAKYSGEQPGDFSDSPTWPAIAGMLPDCRDVYLPERSHFIPMEDPGLVAGYIAEALDA